MKKIFLPAIVLASAAILALAGYTCYFFQRDNKDALVLYEKKHGPADFFFMQRSYPDKSFDYKAYLKVMQVEATHTLMKTDYEIPQWRLEGPENIGGRINVVVAHPQNHNIMLVGNVTGGIYKTIDGGTHWYPVFDQHPYLSIGALVFDPVNPEILYAGTGDPNIGGYPFIGNGLYRSADTGETWEHLGLEEVGIISRISVNPKNNQVIYVSAMGIPFERSIHRGLYKTTDGGQTWTKILYIADNAGIIDLAMNPQHPDTLFAAAWNRIRNNHESIVYGEDARIYRTYNGGTDWTLLTNGLPQDVHSRIGLSMNQSNPDQLLALYISTVFETEGIFQTVDGGNTWTEIPISTLDGSALGGFGWYFGQIRINPYNHNQFFLLGVDLHRTDNAGQTWQMVGPPWYTYEFHADKHDLIFLDQNTIIVSTDGGLYKSEDAGDTFTDIENIPNTQFYRIAVDPVRPGKYAGGAQDNGTSYGNFETAGNWEKIYGGDGFQPVFDPVDPGIMYTETQNGGLVYTTDFLSQNYWFDDFTSMIDENDRRSWDMPLTMSPLNHTVLYTGTYRVYKITNAPYGNWSPISGDLTEGTNNRYHVITVVEPSPLDANVIYAGASDGYASFTNNGGSNWTSIREGLPVRYITCIKASADLVSRVFISHSGYKDNEFIPHIHRSDDYGNNWVDISSDLPQLAINHIEILPGHSDSVLFVATDGGVYHTLNGGQSWVRTGSAMPAVPVYDIAYDQHNNRIIAGTHARSMMSISVDSLLMNSGNSISRANTMDVKIYAGNGNKVIIFAPQAFKNVRITISDMSGKMIFHQLKNLSQGENHFELPAVPEKIYIIHLQQGGKRFSKKIMLHS